MLESTLFTSSGQVVNSQPLFKTNHSQSKAGLFLMMEDQRDGFFREALAEDLVSLGGVVQVVADFAVCLLFVV